MSSWPTDFLQTGTPAATWRSAPVKVGEVFAVTDFGAQGGTNLDTSHFQDALAALIANGGGTLDIPWTAAGYYTVGPGALSLPNTVPIHIRGNGMMLKYNATGTTDKLISIAAGLSATGPKHIVEGLVLQSNTANKGVAIYVEDCGSQCIRDCRIYDFYKGVWQHNEASTPTPGYCEHNEYQNVHCRGGSYGWYFDRSTASALSMATTTWIGCAASSSGATTPWTGLFIDSGVSIYRANFDGLTIFPATDYAVGFACNGSITSARGKLNFEDNSNPAAATTRAILLGPDASGFTSHDVASDLRGVVTSYDLTNAVSPFTTSAIAIPTAAAFATATSGGTLTASTHYFYRISAINKLGETLACAEVDKATGAGGNTNTITANWLAVTGATGYKIYGRSTGAELLIATVGAVLTYTDTGSITPSGALPTGANQGTNTLGNACPYISSFDWKQLNYLDGAADLLKTSVLTKIRRIGDTSTPGNLLSELRRTSANVWEWRFDGLVQFFDISGNNQTIKGNFAASKATAALADDTPTVLNLCTNGILRLPNTVLQDITFLDDGFDSQIIVLKATTNNLNKLKNSTTFKLKTGADVLMTTGQVVVMQLDGASWWQINS